ncbi:transposase [Chloroflexus sp.]|uniref:transposase n=1 Tax=Chloroflexus sp. TaxID=1904827 RepID=UPI004049A3ED
MPIIAAHRPAFRQERTFRRAVVVLFGELFAFARPTVTQVLLALGMHDTDATACSRLFSRSRVDEATLNTWLFRETLKRCSTPDPYMIGIDSTQIPRRSLTLPGTRWLHARRTVVFKRGLHRAQRFGHCAWLPPRVKGFTRAIPLRCLPAFPPTAAPADVPSANEWEVGVACSRWVRQQLTAAGRAAQWVVVLADGARDTVGMWRGLPAQVALIVRTARNHCRSLLPPQTTGRGRPRQDGKRDSQPASWLATRELFRRQRVLVRGRWITMRYHIHGPSLCAGVPGQAVFPIVIGGAPWQRGKRRPRRGRREPALYLVTAVATDTGWVVLLSVGQIPAWVWQRWDLEGAHRERKAGGGVGQNQCWNKRSAVVSVPWRVWVSAVLVLAGYRTWGWSRGSTRPERWWRVYGSGGVSPPDGAASGQPAGARQHGGRAGRRPRTIG